VARKRQTGAEQADLTGWLAGSRYAGALLPAGQLQLDGLRAQRREALRKACPQLPGAYVLVDGDRQAFYVGMSRCLRRRLLAYVSSSRRRGKETRLGRRARQMLWQPAVHEFVAQLRERELIRQFRPEQNVEGQPIQIALGYLTLQGHPAGSFALQPHIPRSHRGIWGPIPATEFWRRAAAELNVQFQLRDCPAQTPMHFRDDAPASDLAPGCLRGELRTCLTPCAGGCTHREYDAAVASAVRFLNGRSPDLLQTLEREMAAAAQRRQFERAARLRDRLDLLARVDGRLRRVHDWNSQAQFVYRLHSAVDGKEWWMLVVRGTIIEMLPRPRTPDEKGTFAKLLQQAQQPLQGEGTQAQLTGPDEYESGRLLRRWFRRHPEEKQSRLTLAKAARLCQITRP
jgi:excinuclease ABC subunit C